MALAIWASAINLISRAVKGVFGLKGKQADLVQEAIKVVNDVNASEARKEIAQAQILAAEMRSDSWLARTWRPLFMLVCMAIVVSFWFGYVPPHITKEMPPIIAELFSLIKIGLGGYIGARSVEKIFKEINLGKLLKTFIDKKLL